MKSKRRIPLTADLIFMPEVHRDIQALEAEHAGEQWQDTRLVFTTETGAAVNARNALRAVTAAAKKAGLEDVNVHTLRHSAATMLTEAGVPDKVLQHPGARRREDDDRDTPPRLRQDRARRDRRTEQPARHLTTSGGCSNGSGAENEVRGRIPFSGTRPLTCSFPGRADRI